ncbi:MAG: TIGR03960 family B12-binding radical SAM protein, partial [Candidatus Cloacimonadales bacterium]
MKKFQPVKYDHLLASVLKPSRYINNEIYSRYNLPSEDKLNFCLAYPDVYEVGFSHLGIKILYSILNKLPHATADRVYAPWPDFGKLLQENTLPLFALESEAALKDFDVLGFTLQSELTYTNILYMLQLSDIPLWQKERGESDPIILGGGPCATNPEAIADFFDAFLIGDGEEAIVEIYEVLLAQKSASRSQKLLKLAEIRGVYVPSLYQQVGNQIVPIDSAPAKISARKFMDFDNLEKKYTDQLVPWLQPTHERYVAEAMRGCTRGCRFCHAGIFYRPFRERDPQQMLDQLLAEVKKSGWDEAALTSLSTSDYSCIKPVLIDLYEKLQATNSSLSLPSLRVDTIDDEISKLLNAMRQTGLTIAPEAGSQRLRNIINKTINEDDIMQSVQTCLDNNWRLIKLYFMIGLPFETEEDIDAIIDLIKKIIALAGKRLQINVTISPFVPKSHTPFQWAGLGEREELIRKATKIKFCFSKQNFVKIKYHDVESLLLEAVIGRGDRSISQLIFQAYQKDALYDGWQEYFDFARWQSAATELELDLDAYVKPKEL